MNCHAPLRWIVFLGILVGSLAGCSRGARSQRGEAQAVAGQGELALAPVFSDHMVLQREAAIPVWGRAAPGERVVIRMGGQRRAARADERGAWRVMLGPMKPGGPYELSVRGISGGSPRIARVGDVLVGDVWICAGQSNMEWSLGQSVGGAEAIAAASSKHAGEGARGAPLPIRLCQAPRAIDGLEPKTAPLVWQRCTSNSLESFSAAGFLFGRNLQPAVGVPIGLVNTAIGATLIQPWTPRAALAADPKLRPIVERYEQALRDAPAEEAAYKAFVEQHGLQAEAFEDPGNEGVKSGWADARCDDAGWESMELPRRWARAGEGALNICGAVWFRKEVEIPAAWQGQPLALCLGPIDDFDVAYFNGRKIGETGPKDLEAFAIARRYVVPAGCVQAGRAVIAVRVFNRLGDGGFTGLARQMELLPVRGGDAALPLAGAWKYKIEVQRPFEPPPPTPVTRTPHDAPGVLYDWVIAPLTALPIRGVAWYQGEFNTHQGGLYRALLPAMIRGWRDAWGQGDIPFIIVQLPNYTRAPSVPEESRWAELREAQAMAAALPNTALVTTIDIGDAGDIHPKDKRELGRRMALAERALAAPALAARPLAARPLAARPLAARAQLGERGVAASGPVYESMQREGNRIRLRFRNAAGGLCVRGGTLRQFAIAGEDRRFQWAKAAIEGETVIVWSEAVPNPVAVRYAWANNPEGCNLYNKDALPAVPFRTDDWPGIGADQP